MLLLVWLFSVCSMFVIISIGLCSWLLDVFGEVLLWVLVFSSMVVMVVFRLFGWLVLKLMLLFVNWLFWKVVVMWLM